jgi:hypothetical protein
VTATEAHRKGRTDYRDETHGTLLFKAWKLQLRAIAFKDLEGPFYRTNRTQPCRTLSLRDASKAKKRRFPAEVDPIQVMRNPELVTTYRDKAVDFYNEFRYSALLWALAPVSNLNYRHLILKSPGL